MVAEREECARVEFSELASGLHHLVSTRAIPGVYNPPYSQFRPQAFNVDVETHLRSTFKANYKWQAPSAEKINLFKEIARQQIRNRVMLGVATQ